MLYVSQQPSHVAAACPIVFDCKLHMNYNSQSSSSSHTLAICSLHTGADSASEKGSDRLRRSFSNPKIADVIRSWAGQTLAGDGGEWVEAYHCRRQELGQSNNCGRWG